MTEVEEQMTSKEDATTTEPSSNRRPSRVRKAAKVLTYEVKEKEVFSVKEGKGVKLGDMEGVCLQLSRLKANDIVLSSLHRIFFNRAPKKTTMRKFIRDFCGFPADSFDQDKERAINKLDKMTLPLLKRMYDTLLLDRSAKSFESGKVEKDTLVDRLVGWMESPSMPTKEPPMRKPKKAKKPKRKKKKPKKKERVGPKRALSSYMYFCSDVRAKTAEENKEMGAKEIMTKLGEMWRALSDEDKKPYEAKALADKERYQTEMEDFQSKSKKKRKRPANKKQSVQKKKKKVVQEESSDDDSSDDDDLSFQQIELQSKLVAMLKDPSLDKEAMTTKKLRKALEKKMGVSLKHQKAFIKKVVFENFSS